MREVCSVEEHKMSKHNLERPRKTEFSVLTIIEENKLYQPEERKGRTPEENIFTLLLLLEDLRFFENQLLGLGCWSSS